MKARSHKRFAKRIQLEEKVVFKETNALTTTKSGMKVCLKIGSDATHAECMTNNKAHTCPTTVKDQVEEMNSAVSKQM